MSHTWLYKNYLEGRYWCGRVFSGFGKVAGNKNSWFEQPRENCVVSPPIFYHANVSEINTVKETKEFKEFKNVHRALYNIQKLKTMTITQNYENFLLNEFHLQNKTSDVEAQEFVRI